MQHIQFPTPDGPLELPVISLPASAFADLPGCTWLMPAIDAGVLDAVPYEALVHGRRCEDGHQLGVVEAPNFGAPELN